MESAPCPPNIHNRPAASVQVEIPSRPPGLFGSVSVVLHRARSVVDGNVTASSEPDIFAVLHGGDLTRGAPRRTSASRGRSTISNSTMRTSRYQAAHGMCQCFSSAVTAEASAFAADPHRRALCPRGRSQTSWRIGRGDHIRLSEPEQIGRLVREPELASVLRSSETNRSNC